jgi:hypothetical protein
MFFAQRLEVNLRVILHTSNYWGFGNEMELDMKEIERFKHSDGFIDNATCGALIEKFQRGNVVRFKTQRPEKGRTRRSLK